MVDRKLYFVDILIIKDGETPIYTSFLSSVSLKEGSMKYDTTKLCYCENPSLRTHIFQEFKHLGRPNYPVDLINDVFNRAKYIPPTQLRKTRPKDERESR